MILKQIKQHKFISVLAAALIIAAAVCSVFIVKAANMLPTQQVWKVWRGDNEMPFSQISVFISESQNVGVSDINDFRTKAAKALSDASIVADDGRMLFTDCWSTSGTAMVSSDRSSNTVSVIAAGGNFFDFHPLKLVDGSYLSPDDLNLDSVLVDRRLAWFFFGGIDVAGLTIDVEGTPYVIAGVVELENDFASKKADSSEMMLFMHYDAYAMLHSGDGTSGISCYEIILPDPVKNFAINIVNSNFTFKKIEIAEITGRFSLISMFKALFNMPASVINKGIALPYWENAGRYALNHCAALLGVACLCLLLIPVPGLIIGIIKSIIFEVSYLKYDVILDAMEKAEETIRVRERKHWEKKHPNSHD